MKDPFVHGVGGVMSADIAVPDHERELDFYSKVLTTGDTPLWRDDLLNNRGMPIIGLGVRTPEYDALPLQWIPHFQVVDVAASAARAIDMGGKELMHGKDDNGQSQWAGLVDPEGAAFGVIPVVPRKSHALQQNVSQGCISWLSLAVSNVSSTGNFYKHVIGWNAKAIGMGDDESVFAKLEMQIDDETSVAEIYQFGSEKSKIPSVWLIHLPVGDLVESLGYVRKGGGEVIEEFAEAKYAIVRDPVGAFLALTHSDRQKTT